VNLIQVKLTATDLDAKEVFAVFSRVWQGLEQVQLRNASKRVYLFQKIANATNLFELLDEDGEFGPRVAVVLEEFQRTFGVPPSGAVDRATVEVLLRLVGGESTAFDAASAGRFGPAFWFRQARATLERASTGASRRCQELAFMDLVEALHRGAWEGLGYAQSQALIEAAFDWVYRIGRPESDSSGPATAQPGNCNEHSERLGAGALASPAALRMHSSKDTARTKSRPWTDSSCCQAEQLPALYHCTFKSVEPLSFDEKKQRYTEKVAEFVGLGGVFDANHLIHCDEKVLTGLQPGRRYDYILSAEGSIFVAPQARPGFFEPAPGHIILAERSPGFKDRPVICAGEFVVHRDLAGRLLRLLVSINSGNYKPRPPSLVAVCSKLCALGCPTEAILPYSGASNLPGMLAEVICRLRQNDEAQGDSG